MDYKFSEPVLGVLKRAREEAFGLGHDYVGTEHILLGLLGEGEGDGEDLVELILTNLSVDRQQLRKQVGGSVRPGRAKVSMGELPYTSRAKKVLEFAMAEAREIERIAAGVDEKKRTARWRLRGVRSSSVGTEHLLLGLLREEKGIAAEVLNQFGVTLETARRETLRLLDVGPFAPEVTAGPGGGNAAAARFRVRVDDTSDLSVYEQIIARVTEAVATGELKPGDRLPTVRKLAEYADIAPGTVARAYSELERQGVVVTQGARGTRVATRIEPIIGDPERPEMLVGLLRPVAVAAFHLGAGAAELRTALEVAMHGIFDKDGPIA